MINQGHRIPVGGWGRATRSAATVLTPGSDDDWAGVFGTAGRRGLIVRGGGRSYGDAAQNAGGLVVSALAETSIGEADPATATVEAGAGVTVGELVRRLAPLGWTLPVVPGSAGVTVGGAIAADVHGKNHGRHGTFGGQVAAMTVQTPAYGVTRMSPTVNADEFWATVGGLGLTDVIRRAVLRQHRGRPRAGPLRPRHLRPLTALHFPLDALPGWPGLHGRRGLIQYQFAVPFGAEQVLAEALRAAGQSPSLAVLKVFGAANPAPLSFPTCGWSLALDFAADPALAPALDRLDERVAAAGGRVYLVKDSRLRPDLIAAMYPGLARWQAIRSMLDPDQLLVSDLARRLRLTDQRITSQAGAGRA